MDFLIQVLDRLLGQYRTPLHIIEYIEQVEHDKQNRWLKVVGQPPFQGENEKGENDGTH